MHSVIMDKSVATLRIIKSRNTRGKESEVLAYKKIQTKSLRCIADISRTVLQRSELKSRTVLMVEQTNPWKRLHLQDTAIQHRGGKLLLR